MIDNKLGITDVVTLEHEEERLSKIRALELYDKKLLDTYEVGTYKGLSAIHKYLFQDIYDFAGKMRNVNLTKGSFCFAPRMYLPEALTVIDRMPQRTFDEIIDKYVEMNVAHPFREGNGRSMRIWLNCILKKELEMVIDWCKIEPKDYLAAMECSPIRDTEISQLLKSSLTVRLEDRQVFINNIDASYRMEGLSNYILSEHAVSR